MNASDLVLLGLRNSVTALDRNDGRIVWTTRLSPRLSEGFVTLTCDDRQVFAYACGQIHCLDLFSGRMLWSNELKGYGYGIASISLPGSTPAPAASAAAQIASQNSQSAGAAATAGA